MRPSIKIAVGIHATTRCFTKSRQLRLLIDRNKNIKPRTTNPQKAAWPRRPRRRDAGVARKLTLMTGTEPYSSLNHE
jgi:hypothetical protein